MDGGVDQQARLDRIRLNGAAPQGRSGRLNWPGIPSINTVQHSRWALSYC